MKWLTQKQVKEHATTPTKARNISEKHHQQVCDATAKEIREYQKQGRLLHRPFCGLCQYYNENDVFCISGTNNCPLAKMGECCNKIGSQWEKINDTYRRWLNHNGGSFQTFKKEARKMLKLIKSLKGK